MTDERVEKLVRAMRDVTVPYADGPEVAAASALMAIDGDPETYGYISLAEHERELRHAYEDN